MHIVRIALEKYAARYGEYPETEGGLKKLVEGVGEHGPLLTGGKESLIDAWGNPLLYHREEDLFYLESSGPDSKAGTADDFSSED